MTAAPRDAFLRNAASEDAPSQGADPQDAAPRETARGNTGAEPAGNRDPVTAKELAGRGLAQALAAALWESEPASAPAQHSQARDYQPLPSAVPGLMDYGAPSYTTPSPEALAAAAWDIPVATSVRAKAKKAAQQQSDEPPVWFTESMDELLRLQGRQQEHVEKLYAENRVLRGGELAHALAPLLTGLTKVYDQMARLSQADGPGSSAELLQTQLLQVLEHSASVEIYEPEPGVKFDPTRQRGVAAVDTVDRVLDGRVSQTMRPGFLHQDGTVIRVAEVEVLRFRADDPGDNAVNDGP